MGGHVRLAEKLRGEPALVAVVEDTCEWVVAERAAVAGAVHDLQSDVLEALGDVLVLLLHALGRASVPRAVRVQRLGRHAAGADHPRRAGRRALDVAADAGRVLPVEDALRCHRAEGPDQLRHLLRAPGAEALLLLARLVVAERRAAPLDREAGRFRALQVDVRGGRVAGLVDRDRPRLLGNVLGADRRSRLDGRHRLDDVLPGEGEAPVVVGDRQRHRADLLDHGRRVAVGDAGELVAALLGDEVLVVRDLVQIEVEDVEPVALRRRPEPDVAPHATRAGERRIEHLHRHVRRSDEVDLVPARPRRR